MSAVALLGCHELCKAYAGRELFSGLTLAVHPGERVGLIGPNGAGKSTLLRVLAGLDVPDAGEVAKGQGIGVAYLPQDEAFPEDRSAESLVEEALQDLDLDQVTRQTRARIALGKAGFDDPAILAGTLSGGWRKRLSLARVLAREPDLLLLDEPTNHLDLRGIRWLEKLLASASFACLIITHDRYLLERVANRVVEIGRHYPGGHLRVEGNYSAFLLKRADILEAQSKHEQALANTVRREVEWLRRGPRGRGTKAKDRIARAHETMRELDEVRSRNRAGGAADIDFSGTGRKTRDLLVAEGLTKSRGGPPLFAGLDLRLGPGDRLGLLGDNGSGKSTLLSILADELEPDAGTVRLAKHLRRVVFHQDRARLDPEATLREALCSEGDTVQYRGRAMHVTAWAKRFHFDAEQLGVKVGALSGGEQARLLIADLVRQPADLLLLDEPTNDLDLPTREVLEESLLDFPGALILVTHDRYMLERVCTGLVGIDGQGGAHLLADLDQWQRLRDRQGAEAKALKQAARAEKEPAAAPRQRTKKLSYKEQREWDAMEETISAAESNLDALKAKVEDPDILADHVALQEAYAALHEAEARVEALYARWEELESKRG